MMMPAILRGLAPGVLALCAMAAAAQTAPATKPPAPLKASAAPAPFQGAGALYCQLDSPGASPALMLLNLGPKRTLGLFADDFRSLSGTVQATVTYPTGVTETLRLTRKGYDMLMIDLTPQAQSRLLDNLVKPGKIVVQAAGKTVEFPLNNPAPAVATMRGCVSQLQAKLGQSNTVAAASPAPMQQVRPSDAKRFADARQWDHAVRAALTSTDRDKLEVLLALQGSSTNDSQRWPGEQVVLANMHLFDAALRVANDYEKQRLIAMRQDYWNFMAKQNQSGQAAAPGSPNFGSPSAPSSSSVRTAAPQRCYQVSKDRQVCYN